MALEEDVACIVLHDSMRRNISSSS